MTRIARITLKGTLVAFRLQWGANSESVREQAASLQKFICEDRC